MKNFPRYTPLFLCAVAGILAFAIASEPGEAEASRELAAELSLRASIIDLGATAAPACPEAVWPYLAVECVLHPTAETATRTIRRIEVDDRTVRARRQELERLAIGR